MAKKGVKFTEEHKHKLRKAHLGMRHTKDSRQKMSKSAIGKHKGEKSNWWKGGISDESKRVRVSIEYSLWRESVFARDGWTCQKYGTIGGKLHAHHILNFSEYPKLRFALDNGITFSYKAHKEFHRKYGIKKNTSKQLQEFLNQ